MKSKQSVFQAPDGTYITIPDGRVICYGVTHDELVHIRKCVPNRNFEVYATHDASDIVAIDAAVIIVKASELKTDDLELLTACYKEIKGCFDHTILWLGEPRMPEEVKGIQYFNDFSEIMESLKYRILSAHRKVNKSRTFSKNLSDCLLILSLIRSHPGIKSQEIASKIELPVRTVQRHISTLQATGEWIDYDSSKRGWYLQDGISILFGDHMSCAECKFRNSTGKGSDPIE